MTFFLFFVLLDFGVCRSIDQIWTADWMFDEQIGTMARKVDDKEEGMAAAANLWMHAFLLCFTCFGLQLQVRRGRRREKFRCWMMQGYRGLMQIDWTAAEEMQSTFNAENMELGQGRKIGARGSRQREWWGRSFDSKRRKGCGWFWRRADLQNRWMEKLGQRFQWINPVPPTPTKFKISFQTQILKILWINNAQMFKKKMSRFAHNGDLRPDLAFGG